MGAWERVKTTDSTREYVYDTERYTDAVVIPHVRDGQVVSEQDRAPHNYCSRAKCQELVYMQNSSVHDGARRWRYSADVVVVSLEDGEKKFAYCSLKCAALDLTSKSKNANKEIIGW